MSADRIDVLADLRDYADAKAAAYLRALHALPAKGANAEQLAKVAKLKAAADAAASTRAAVAELIAAAEKAKAALLTGQIGHINSDDVGVYHLDGITCGNALNALRAALARVGGAA